MLARAISWGLIIGLGGAGCASSPEPTPDPGEIAPAAHPPAGEPETAAPQPLIVDTASDVEVGLNLDSLLVEIREDAVRERAPSVLPFGVAWTPVEVVEGSPVAFRVLQPRGGRKPTSVRGVFADRQVRFGMVGNVWLGLAAVPIGVSGQRRLELEFGFDDGFVRRRNVDVRIAPRRWDKTNLSVAPGFSSPPPEVQGRIARERRRIRSVLDDVSPGWLLEGSFAPPRPVDITSPFGQERVFNGELQSRHTGLDLRGSAGDPVYSAGRGRVVLTGDFYYSGNGIFIDHGLGVYTGYFHLSEILVDEGEIVGAGDLIGRVGATGRVTGPHLHWSLWVGGVGQDAGSLLGMELPGAGE